MLFFVWSISGITMLYLQIYCNHQIFVTNHINVTTKPRSKKLSFSVCTIMDIVSLNLY